MKFIQVPSHLLGRLTVAVTVVMAGMGSVSAHEVWVDNAHTHGGEILKTNLGYGDFPALMPIAKDREHIFKKPMQLISQEGTQDLLQIGEHNYQYQSKSGLAEGSYLVTAEYSPTFWSQNKNGWKQVSMAQMPDATYCEQTRMYGKSVLNVGHDGRDTRVVTKPIGQGLEIVPLDNPANIEVGKPFPLKVFFNGKPLEGETVVATFKGFAPKDPNDHYHKLEPQAFSDTTRPDGSVQLYPWSAGQWKVRVVHKSAYPEPAVCQKLASYATLTFDVGTIEQIHAMYKDDHEHSHHHKHDHKHDEHGHQH